MTAVASVAPRSRSPCSASATTAPARPARCWPRWRELRPDLVLIEGPPEADALVGWAAIAGHAAAGGAAGLRADGAAAGGVLAVRGVLARSGRR